MKKSDKIEEPLTNVGKLHAYHDALVRKGLDDMREGRLVSHHEVAKRLKTKRRASR